MPPRNIVITKPLMTTLAGIALALILGTVCSPAQVVINEFVAAPATWLLHREPGVYPRPGITTPWIAPNFDDSQWAAGPGPLGFGSFSGVTFGTELSASLQNRAASLYARRAFQASPAQAASAASLELVIRHNDGFIAFLNGVEVARRNLGNSGMFVFHDQNAYSTNHPGAPLVISIGSASNHLQAGENVLCLQVHNQTLSGTEGSSAAMATPSEIASTRQVLTRTRAGG